MTNGRDDASVGYAVRDATPDDLETIAALSRSRRDDLAAWSPAWWAKAEAADEIHPLWVEHLLNGGAVRVMVVEADGVAVGCACALDQGTQFFIDDVVFRSGHHLGGMQALVDDTTDHRPALTCIPTRDAESLGAIEASGSELVSTYWVIETLEGAVETEPFLAPTVTRRASHTFGGTPLDPSVDGALAFTCRAGSVKGSPSLTAPPVYDPGGTVAVVDLVTGSDLSAALVAARCVAGSRDDSLLAVVCDSGDLALADALEDSGFRRTVEVFSLAG